MVFMGSLTGPKLSRVYSECNLFAINIFMLLWCINKYYAYAMCASRCIEIARRIRAKTEAMKPSELTKPEPNRTEQNRTWVNLTWLQLVETEARLGLGRTTTWAQLQTTLRNSCMYLGCKLSQLALRVRVQYICHILCVRL